MQVIDCLCCLSCCVVEGRVCLSIYRLIRVCSRDSLISTNDGIPKPYTISLVQIRLLETGEEGWTWSKAIEFDK